MAHIEDELTTYSSAETTKRSKIERWFQSKFLSFKEYQDKFSLSIDDWETIIGPQYYDKEADKLNKEALKSKGFYGITPKTIILRAIATYLNRKPEKKVPSSITRTRMDSSTQARIQQKIVPVYPEDTMGYEHPVGTWASIQFRTSFTESDITKDSVWEEIVFNPNMFLQSLELDDNKGIKRINIELIDQYYTTLENVLQKCITATQLSNKISGTQRQTGSSTNPFNFIVNTASFINLRIRFGYTNDIRKKEDFIDTINNDEFKKRVNDKRPVLRTPWLMFQILSMKQQYADEGLRVSLSAISSSNSFFNKARMIKKFSIIRGTPVNILKDIATSISEIAKKISTSSGSISFAEFSSNSESFYDDVSKYSQPPLSKNQIEVQLGDKPKLDVNGNIIEEFKTMKDLLDEVVAKVPPLKIMSDGSLKEKWEGEEAQETERFSNYQYVIDEESTGASKVRFYYSNPDTFFLNKDSIFLRTYFWRETSKTIVKSINIQTDTDFAQMNMPIFTVTEEGKKIEVVYNNGEGNQSIKLNLGANGVKDITSILDEDSFDFSFVSQGQTLPAEGSTDVVSLVTQKFIQNINSSVFRGTVELMGDPFFLFDTVLQPFQYLIKLVVMRPTSKMTTRYNSQNEEESSPISYISGFYSITNIKHKIGLDGYSTTLEVMRWPSLFKVATPGTRQTQETSLRSGASAALTGI